MPRPKAKNAKGLLLFHYADRKGEEKSSGVDL